MVVVVAVVVHTAAVVAVVWVARDTQDVTNNGQR